MYVYVYIYVCMYVDGGFHFPLFHSAPHPSGFPLTSSSLLKDASSTSSSFQSLLKRDVEGMLGIAGGQSILLRVYRLVTLAILLLQISRTIRRR